MKVKFAPHNDFGILDHFVTLPNGAEVLNPVRVLTNGKGSEVIFSIFQIKSMTTDQFKHDSATVAKDLKKLKQVLEKK